MEMSLLYPPRKEKNEYKKRPRLLKVRVIYERRVKSFFGSWRDRGSRSGCIFCKKSDALSMKLRKLRDDSKKNERRKVDYKHPKVVIRIMC